VIIEAEKSGEEPKIQKFPLPYPKNPIKKFLAKYFNMKLVLFLRNGTMFPTPAWFREQMMKLRQKRKPDNDYRSARVKPDRKPLYENRLDIQI